MVEIHVSTSGSDFSGTGTQSQPLKTPQEAIRRAEEIMLSLSPDDVSIIMDTDGMYEPFVLTFTAFTSPLSTTNRLSISADIGRDVVFDGKCIIEGQMVDVAGVSFSSDDDDALQLWNVSNSTISDCGFSSALKSGLHLSGSGTNLKVDASKFNGSSIGLEIDSASDYRFTHIIDSQIHDNFIGVKMGSFGSVNLSLNTIAYNVDGLQIGDITDDELENFVSSNIIAFNSNGIVFKNGNEALIKTHVVNNDVFGNVEDYVGIADQVNVYDNFSADPMFNNGPGRDFYLQPTSPCIGMATMYFESVRDYFNENRFNKLATISDVGSLNNTVSVIPLTPLQIDRLMFSTHVDHWLTNPDMTIDRAALKKMQLFNTDVASEQAPDGSQHALRFVPKGNDASSPSTCELGSKYYLETFAPINATLFDVPVGVTFSANRARWSPAALSDRIPDVVFPTDPAEFNSHPISLKPSFSTTGDFDFQVDIFKYSFSVNAFGSVNACYAKLQETGHNFSIELYYDDPNEYSSSREYYWRIRMGTTLLFKKLLTNQSHIAGFAGRVRMRKTGTSIHFYIDGNKEFSTLYSPAPAVAQITCDGLHIAEFANLYISMADGIPLPNACAGNGHKGTIPSKITYRDAFTVIFWVKNLNFNGANQRVLEISAGSGGSTFIVDFTTPTLMTIPDLGVIPVGDITLGGTNGWHNFVITRRLDRVFVYQNKSLVADLFNDTLWGGGDLVINEESGNLLHEIKVQHRFLDRDFVEFYYDNIVIDQGTIVLP